MVKVTKKKLVLTCAFENGRVVTLKTGHTLLLEEVGKYLQQQPELRKE